MLRILRTARFVTRTLIKFLRGTTVDRIPFHVGLNNAAQILRFLVGLKIGMKADCRVSIKYAGQKLVWTLCERSDLSILEEIFIDLEYHVDIPPPKVIIDLGANVGVASISFALRWPDTRILAIEPNPPTYKRLVESTRSFPNITCVNCAVGGHDGFVQFYSSSNHQSSSLRAGDLGAQICTVLQKTLRTVMREANVQTVDLLKFDIEGAEDELFLELDVLGAIRAFVGEVHPHLMRIPVQDFLRRLGTYKTATHALPGGCFLLSGTRAT